MFDHQIGAWIEWGGARGAPARVGEGGGRVRGTAERVLVGAPTALTSAMTAALGASPVRGNSGATAAAVGGGAVGTTAAAVAPVAAQVAAAAGPTAEADGTAPVGRVATAVSELRAAARSVADWTAAECAATVAESDRLIGVLGLVRGEVLLAVRGSGTDRAAVDWRARIARSHSAAATGELRQAETLAQMPAVADGIAAGTVGEQHVRALTRTVAAGGDAVREVLARPAVQREVAELAADLDAAEFGSAVTRLAASIDPDTVERDHQQQRARRFLTMSTTPGGTLLKGRLDNVAGRHLRHALEALSPRPAADDDRSPEQRRADALVLLADRALEDRSTTPGAAVRPHVSVLVSEESWQRWSRHREGGRTRSETESGLAAELPTWEDGTPLPPTEAARLSCDCELTRIVMDARSEPVDLGRTQRVYSGVQRRAVISRDRQCTWPGCGMHARWCEVHHIRWWGRDGGETSVANGVLLCSFHHHAVHERDLVITRLPRAPRALVPAEIPAEIKDRSRRAVSYEFRTRSGTLVAPSARPAAVPTAARAPATALGPTGSGREPPDAGPSTQVAAPCTGTDVPLLALE